MTHDEVKQLELFSHDTEEPRLRGRVRPAQVPFTDYIRHYEKAVLILIGLVITAIISFCAGVERGKNASLSQTHGRFDVAITTQPQSTATPKQNPIAVAPGGRLNGDGSVTIRGKYKDMPVKQEIILNPSPQQQSGSYTVQIASYQAREGAEREIAKLRKNGFSPLTLQKGSYTVVCVGTFNTKETARSLLTQLRSKYRDCYIRRL